MSNFADRVKETTTTTGTGTVDLGGTTTGFDTFVTGIGNGNTCYYAIVHRTLDEWEVGIGTVTDATPDTLSRNSVLASSNSGAAVSFSAGTKDVFVTIPAAAVGTVMVVGAGSLTSTAIVTGGGGQLVQTPSAGSTLDASGNMVLGGTLLTGGGITSLAGIAATEEVSAVGGFSVLGEVYLRINNTEIIGVDGSGNIVISPGVGNTVTINGLTTARIVPRITSVASSATPTPNADTDDQYILTALAAGATFAVPSGTPTQGQKLVIRIKDNASPQTLAWNAIYRAIGVLLPTTTTTSKTLYVGMIYNDTDDKWDVLAVSEEE